MTIKSFSDFLTESTKDVTFTFGRYNPPTIGHEVLFDAVKKQARSGAYRIYTSKSQDKKKNPLEFKEKIKYVRKLFPKHARAVMGDKNIRTVFDIVNVLYEQGFTKVTMVVGSDRVVEFNALLDKYNGVKGRHGFYNFEQINVVSAGNRDPDLDGAAGMSASKLRELAQQNDLANFAKGLPSGFKDASGLFNAVRKGMGLTESRSFRQHIELPPVSQTREEYIEGSLFKVGDLVRIKENNEKGRIIVCGSNYLMVESEGIRKRCWLDSVELVEEGGAGDFGTSKALNKYLKDTPFSQLVKPKTEGDHKQKRNKAYMKGVSKSTADKRQAQFNKQTKMDDDNPAAYKPAPGDKTAKTKPSKHTKKFKAMFGEFADHITFEDFMVKEGGSDAALKKKADKSGMPLGILKQVFNRGVAAWRTGHRPGTNPTQWGLARVNSFVTKSSGTWGKADKDLAAKVRGN
tara:strand:- start:2142 stop:3521 length:1380 start_codon:yes stop_codon:yes gene_type:complete